MTVTESDVDRFVASLADLLLSAYRNKMAPDVVEHAEASEWDATVTKLPAADDSTNRSTVVQIRRNRDGGIHGV